MWCVVRNRVTISGVIRCVAQKSHDAIVKREMIWEKERVGAELQKVAFLYFQFSAIDHNRAFVCAVEARAVPMGIWRSTYGISLR